MTDSDRIEKLIVVIEELKQRVLAQTVHVEECAGDDFLEETAFLRNLIMQLDGLKLRLQRAELH
jgi:hypothetical protein